MPAETYPLLLLAEPTVADRNKLGGGGGTLRFPPAARQLERVGPQFLALRSAFEATRLRFQETAPLQSPE